MLSPLFNTRRFTFIHDRLTHCLERGQASSAGQSLVEFALVLPFLLLLFLGIFDLGRVMFLTAQLSNGAREGARYGSVSGLDPSFPQYVDCTGIRNAVSGLFGIPQDVEIEIHYDDGATVLFEDCDPGRDPELIDRGDRIVVTVSAEVELFTPLVREIGSPRLISFTAARTILRDGTLVPFR